MLVNVAELDEALKDLFGETARRIARDTDLVQRARKLSGPVLAKATVFCLLERPASTLDDLADFALTNLQTDASPQAFAQRLGHEAAPDFFASLLTHALSLCFTANAALLPVLRRFQGVYLRDASLIRLPDPLASLFPARKGKDGKARAALKLVLEMEVLTGQLTAMEILDALADEKSSELAYGPLPRGSLVLEDMGFFEGERLQEYIQQGVYFLTRAPVRTLFFEKKARGKYESVDILAWLRGAQGCHLGRQVWVLAEQKLCLRLLAVRVPEEVARQRRQAVQKDAKGRGRPVSQRKLDLCEWNVLLTNAPADLLGVSESRQVRRVRWQIELVFKAFKSEGGIEKTQSHSRERVLAELYARLLGQLVVRWCLLAAGFVTLRHSALRAARRVRGMAGALARAVGGEGDLGREVSVLAALVRRRCKVRRRRNLPSTFDHLYALDYEFRQLDLAA